MPAFLRRFAAAALCLAPLGAGASPSASDHLARALSQAAPKANPKVLALASRALACVQRSMPANTLSVIDYSLPSTTPRLWVFRLGQQPRLLFHERVAHGRNSGDNMATHFSNRPGSLMSSIGTFVTDGTYNGHNGYSLRLKGIDGRFNDRAEERAIVIHGAKYVSETFAQSQGRLGRSWGCPAVRAGVAHKLIDAIADRSVVFAYYPDPAWLRASKLLGDCDGGEALSSR
ncbi:murein L,D-transpeptidase catalytic domain family protein [Frateuria soli]|uniref:murein L,D-transpeptidase catalytic domain family protein n=1 Tax=Frateuria soli TaxID=1542730 RepID=UPI001E42EC47|nr:murein L,D-transpeptidase catalytic domain family protein [Frateuria soli]UGB39623.1 murein L,D-transpeptidase catalytic domain family protein [Frateuria soli]